MTDTEEVQNETATVVKKSKHRSPNYPSIGLEKALERAQIIGDQAGRNLMPVTVAYNLWGYKQGAGAQTVAALKAFGLIETQGEKLQRQIRLTEAAWRILGKAPDRPELLKAAALNPDIHKDIWDQYGGDLPKADGIIREWLVWKKGFNQSFVDSFIAQFRATIAFAQVGLSDKVRADSQLKVEERRNAPMNTAIQPRIENAPSVGQRVFPLYLSTEQEAALYVPTVMKQSEYDLLKTQIENSLLVMQATSVVPDAKTDETGIEE
jgi:hypothetical protein